MSTREYGIGSSDGETLYEVRRAAPRNMPGVNGMTPTCTPYFITNSGLVRKRGDSMEQLNGKAVAALTFGILSIVTPYLALYLELFGS